MKSSEFHRAFHFKHLARVKIKGVIARFKGLYVIFGNPPHQHGAGARSREGIMGAKGVVRDGAVHCGGVP